jgi:murein L,D-transpeptidase YcbB/YkuD
MSKAHIFLSLLLLVPAGGPALHGSSFQAAQNACQAIKDHASEDPSAAAAAQICSLIESGRLEELRWPDCSSFRTQVRQFYVSSGYGLAWIEQGRPTQQANAMIELFRAAEKKGLDPEDYDASRWPTRLQGLASSIPRSEEPARFDFALTVSSFRYLSDLYQGRVTPKECQVNLPDKPFDATQFLRNEIIHASDVKAAVEKVEPPFDGYWRTLAALERYMLLAGEGDGPALPAIRRSLHPGDPYKGIQELAKQLRRVGDLPANAPMPTSQSYQEPLVSAVKLFQQRHGLEPDGVIGHVTFEELKTPIARRVTQIKLALERWRWLPHNLSPRLLVVNIPEFRLRAYEDHRLALTMRAIVGQALEHQTPIFANELQSIIFRPYWNVPESIQTEELLPLLRQKPGYLAKHKMEVVNAKEEVITASAADAKILDQLALGKLRLRQQPGPANSLGLIKFVFPNQFGVYLHGTPEHGLFFRARRDFSHGCIRVEDPAALAGWVLRDRPEWTNKRILVAMRGKKPISVKVTAPIPVLILYGTVFVEENGEVHFFADIYGHDGTLEKALADRHH